MSKNIEKILKEKVDPVLAEHFGGATLSKFDDGVAYVKLTGACASCPSAQSTVEDVVKEILMAETKEVKDVVLDTSVSDDLIDMARKILNKEAGE
ncbi:MAG: NifU family protein [Anaerovoracaceae bacterium]|jgi:Fe-S cluster biogenesis protein NfuA